MNKVERGIAAKLLLENELLKEILNGLDETYHAKWHTAATVEAREDLHRYVRVLEQLTADIRTIATTGKLEEQRLAILDGRETRPSLNEWKAGNI